MAIQMVERGEGRIGVAIVCDRCGKEIASLDGGNLEATSSDIPSEVMFLHKACSSRAAPRYGWFELSHAAVYLSNTLHVSPKAWSEHVDRAALLSSIG